MTCSYLWCFISFFTHIHHISSCRLSLVLVSTWFAFLQSLVPLFFKIIISSSSLLIVDEYTLYYIRCIMVANNINSDMYV